jgi:hypothetical protein
MLFGSYNGGVIMTILDIAHRLNQLAEERRYFFMCQLAKETAPLWRDTSNMMMLNDVAQMAAIIATEELKEVQND